MRRSSDSQPGPDGRADVPADVPSGLLDALRSDARAAAARREQVARARKHVSDARLDDQRLLEGIATSLLAASGRESTT